MKVENIRTNALIPYENNPRKNDTAVEYVKNSILEFGFRVPLVIDKNNIVICGHTRLKAAQALGMDKVPCLRASDLSDEQVKAFRIADNSTAEVAEWDFDKLKLELDDINLDMDAFGELHIPVPKIDIEDTDDGYYGDERERTFNAYNLELLDGLTLTSDFWQMPIIQKSDVIPTELIGFNYALTSKNRNAGIHFYLDDYQFERVWSQPDRYMNLFMEYDCILSPDFSLYTDMPMPLKVWNVYRSRLLGAYYQSKGIAVIPTVSWAEPETFEFCFKGIPKGSIVSVSTIGVKENADALKIWRQGMEEMLKQIEPELILTYGGALPFDYQGIKVKYYENQVTSAWKKSAEGKK